MLTVQGNKQFEITKKEYQQKISGFERVILDLGTGDGRYVYKKALKNKDNFYVGLDPSAKQLEIYSKKAVRKKLDNLLYVVGSAEIIPKELENSVDKIFIILPWGTLLQKTATPSQKFLKNLKNLYKNGGELEIVLGYTRELEPSEAERLDLPKLSQKHLDSKLVPTYREQGFNLKNQEKLTKKQLKQIETTWSKKLAFGKNRKLFRLKFTQ